MTLKRFRVLFKLICTINEAQRELLYIAEVWLAQRATVGACCEYRRDTIIGIMGVHRSAGVYS